LVLVKKVVTVYHLFNNVNNLPQRHKDTKMHKEKILPLSAEEKRTGKLIVNNEFISEPWCLCVFVAKFINW